MHKNIFLKIATTLLCLPIFLYFAYDFVFYLPHRLDAKEFLKASPAYHQLPDYIPKLIDEAHNDAHRIYGVVSRNLLNRYRDVSKMSTVQWLVEYYLWESLTELHIDKNEIYQYYCLLAYNGEGNGANELSVKLFGKQLDKTTLDESALIVSILWEPNQFKYNKDIVLARKEKLLSGLNGK